jgi:hypothetical protein
MNALQAIVDGRSPDDERTLSFTYGFMAALVPLAILGLVADAVARRRRLARGLPWDPASATG